MPSASMAEELQIMRKIEARAIKDMAEWKTPGFDCVTGDELKA